jgi:hypothetical protein
VLNNRERGGDRWVGTKGHRVTIPALWGKEVSAYDVLQGRVNARENQKDIEGAPQASNSFATLTCQSANLWQVYR